MSHEKAITSIIGYRFITGYQMSIIGGIKGDSSTAEQE